MYCVHCGVKLGEGEPRCPLCGTQSIDPLATETKEAERAFPIRGTEQTQRLGRAYALSLLSLLLLAPALCCILVDVAIQGITWSLYPAGVLSLCWIAVSTPLIMRRHRLYLTLIITTGTLSGYLYMVERLTGGGHWFLPIVLPALGASLLMVCFAVWLARRRKVKGPGIASVALIEAGLLCLLIEWLENGFAAKLNWSPYVLGPCILLSLLVLAISRNRPLLEEMRKRMHF